MSMTAERGYDVGAIVLTVVGFFPFWGPCVFLSIRDQLRTERVELERARREGRRPRRV